MTNLKHAQNNQRAALADQARQDLDHTRRSDASIYVDRQTLFVNSSVTVGT